MADFTLSRLADEDLVNIYVYGYQEYGQPQAERYVRDLYSRFELLAAFPGMGIPVRLEDGPCLKFPSGRHVIYYRRTGQGIRIGRILGALQDPARHDFDI